MLLLDNGVRKKIEEIVGKIDFGEVKVLSELYGIIAASPEGITINELTQKYKLLPLDEIWSIAIILNKVELVSIEYRKSIIESLIKKKPTDKSVRDPVKKTETKPEFSETETGHEINPGGFPIIINKAQMEKAQKLLLLANGVTLAKLLEKLKLPQNPESIKTLLGRLKARFKLVIKGDLENPESCILKIES